MWKGFKVWQKTIQWKKYHDARKYIGENLFFAIPILAETILKIRDEYCQLVLFKFTDISILENWHLFYFIEAQMAQFEQTRDFLYAYRKKIKDLLCKDLKNTFCS